MNELEILRTILRHAIGQAQENGRDAVADAKAAAVAYSAGLVAFEEARGLSRSTDSTPRQVCPCAPVPGVREMLVEMAGGERELIAAVCSPAG